MSLGGSVSPMGMVTSLFVRKMIAATGPGMDQPELLRSVGLDPDATADVKTMIVDTAYYEMLERIAKTVDVTELPLRTGGSMRCDDYGALGLAFKSALTLQGSYARVARYARLWTSVVEYEFEPTGEDTWFHLLRTGPRRLGMRLSNEASLASALAIGREVSPSGLLIPREVHLAHAAPKLTSYHEAYFGCPVFFNSDRDAILFSRGAMQNANKLGDEGITRFLSGHLDRELAEIAEMPSLGERIRDVIARSLSEGLPKMEDVARRLGMSARSLHRRLSEDGLSFQTLTEATRRELAEGLLQDERHSLAEIAFLTGFAEQSSFNRAFKRWAGETPALYRKQLTANATT